jgi:hypothetical protein
LECGIDRFKLAGCFSPPPEGTTNKDTLKTKTHPAAHVRSPAFMRKNKGDEWRDEEMRLREIPSNPPFSTSSDAA